MRTGRSGARWIACWLLGAVLASALAACGNTGEQRRAKSAVGLSTSLPLVWSESGDIRGHLAGQKPRHWALTALQQRGDLVLLDTLADVKRLPSQGLLVLAQPRPLSPEENVALDAWVRRGGRLLLFADPMLTTESDYAIGDPRRPEAIAMLSPILRHWGLELEFDEDQPAGERETAVFGAPLPVNLPGQFRPRGDVPCVVEARPIAAECRIGKGRVIAIADAAVFDGEDAGRTAAFQALLDRLAR